MGSELGIGPRNYAQKPTSFAYVLALLAAAEDTIVALATPNGEGALGLLRLSGPRAIALAGQVCRWLGPDPTHQQARYGTLREADGTLVDEVVVTPYRAPRSYTREEVVEISCHGSPYILGRVLELLVQAGARLAEPGEFTYRAFRNGALDLSQAEAVADLIAARSRAAQQVAIRQLRGGIAHSLADVREQLIQFAALVELELDFAEEDVEFAQRDQLSALLTQADSRLQTLIESFAAGNALKHGFATALVGPPNAGKSTLLNRLLGEERAIVSPIAGTTRDVIEDVVNLGGYPFRLMDTAGLRSSDDPIEAEGVRRSRARMAGAQFVLVLLDATATQPPQAEAYLAELGVPEGAHVLRLANKADALTPEALAAWQAAGFVPLSAQTGLGLEALKQALVSQAQTLTQYDTIVTSQRHVQALQAAQARLLAVGQSLAQGLGGELLALDLRHALEAMGQITGQVTSDDVLGAIFSKFCIGK